MFCSEEKFLEGALSFPTDSSKTDDKGRSMSTPLDSMGYLSAQSLFIRAALVGGSVEQTDSVCLENEKNDTLKKRRPIGKKKYMKNPKRKSDSMHVVSTMFNFDRVSKSKIALVELAWGVLVSEISSVLTAQKKDRIWYFSKNKILMGSEE